jgi:hypothetical protein
LNTDPQVKVKVKVKVKVEKPVWSEVKRIRAKDS